MNIDRRSFLAFGIGGAVGTALSPLPWKLTDDLSIWTQMWPWTPVPLDGAYRYVDSVCTLCPGGCGIRVRMVDDRAVKIEGREGFPINDGGICPLGVSGLQLLYGPARIRSPLKRVGARGEGKWEAVSWDDAISEVGAALHQLRQNADMHALGCISGSASGTVPQLFKRFLTAFGSPNFFTMPHMTDAQVLAMKRMQGMDVEMGFDVENADFILSFGAGILDGWGAPVRMFQSNSGWKEKGARLVQIEPRLSNTAAKSDQWIPINPGTEAALALGMCCVMMQSSLYNADFVNSHTRGFEAFRSRVTQQFSPERAEAITGVPAATIVTLANSFARANRPLALSGRGAGTVPGRLADTAAVYALNILAGNLNREGGVCSVPLPDYVDWPEINSGSEKPRLDRAGSDAFAGTTSLLNRLPGVMENAKDAPIKVLFVHGANPVHGLPGTDAVKAAFEKIPMIVGFSSFMDETSQMADILLPDHHCLEGYRDVPKPPGYCRPFIGLATPVVQPQFNTRYSGDALIALAETLGEEMSGAFPWESYESCLEATLGDKWDTLTENGFWEDTDFKPLAWHRLLPGGAEDIDFTAATDMADPVVDPVGDVEAYPLLLTAFDSIRVSSGYVADSPFMVKTLEDTVIKGRDGFVEVNPETARKYGLSEGSFAKVQTPRGEARVKVHLFDGIKPGVLAMARGLGHTAYDRYVTDKGVNVNSLIGSVEDAASGLDAAWGIRAKLAKA